MARKKSTKISMSITDDEKTKKRSKKSKAKSIKTNPLTEGNTKRRRSAKTKISNPRVKQDSKTAKLRKNVLATIRRAEKRGFRFSSDLKAKLKTARFQTLASYHRDKYRKLYSEATAIDPNTGEIISGTEFRYIERRLSAQKAARTRAQKAEPKPAYEEEVFENEPEFELEEAERQAEFQRRKNDAQYQADLDYGQAGIDAVYEIIENFENYGSGDTGKYFRDIFDEYLQKYTRKTMALAIAQVPHEYFETAQNVIFYEGDENNLARAAMALKKIFDTGLEAIGEKPLYNIQKSLEEILTTEESPFDEEEYYPY